ncbi:MAG TPA: PH domain-containing protein [Chitinophagaceae bacterium]
MKVYRSKISYWIVVPIAIALAATCVPLVIFGLWIAAAVTLVISFALLYLFLSTYYVVVGNTLRVRTGFIFSLEIDIQQLKKIEETRNPISSPALSLDRLQLFYGRGNSVIISPKEKERFIRHLLSVKPGIQVKRYSRGT